MTDFIPPKPRPHKRKLSPLRRILEVRHSSISVLFDRSYSMHLGDVWTPTRNVYFLNQPALVDRVLVKDADKYPKSISGFDARIADASKKSQRTAYIPFSAGPRVCLGASFAMQEGILILAYLAKYFRFEPAEGHAPKPIARLTLRSENGVRLRVLKRDPATPSAAKVFEGSAAPTGGCPFHG